MSYHYKNYWTKEICSDLAKECESRKEFHKKYRAAFNVSSENNWLDEMCSHMIPINNNPRCIYAYEFSDNHVYIGLTYDLNNRDNRHKRNYKNSSTVYNYVEKTKLIPKLKQLTDYLDVNEAKKNEKYFVEKYEKENWIILNRAKNR